MTKALYIVWFLFPLFFFGIALWSKLEEVSTKKAKRENPGDFLQQGLFVLACVIVSVLIDQFVLESIVSHFPDFAPLGFYQIILLPLVLLVAAMTVGPSEKIRISKPPNLSQRKKP